VAGMEQSAQLRLTKPGKASAVTRGCRHCPGKDSRLYGFWVLLSSPDPVGQSGLLPHHQQDLGKAICAKGFKGELPSPQSASCCL